MYCNKLVHLKECFEEKIDEPPNHQMSAVDALKVALEKAKSHMPDEVLETPVKKRGNRNDRSFVFERE